MLKRSSVKVEIGPTTSNQSPHQNALGTKELRAPFGKRGVLIDQPRWETW